MQTRLVMVLWAGLVLAADKASDHHRAEKDNLKGTWALEAVRWGNLDVSGALWKDRKNLRLTFADDHVVIQSGAAKPQKVTYKLDPTKSPREFDIGQGASLKEYIYKLDGDKLIMAFGFGLELTPLTTTLSPRSRER